MSITDPPTLSANAVASNLAQVRYRIRQACIHHERDPDSVRLLAVSKRQSVAAMQAAYAAGQHAFGENYLQEALEKQAQWPGDCEWHFIGPLQSNKTRGIAENFDWVHSVCSLRIAQRLSAQRPASHPPLQLCLQTNLAAEDSKQGVDAVQAAQLATAVRDLPGVQLRGLMCIPPATSDYAKQYRQFADVAELAERLGGLDTLSMGMSADLEAAIAAGSTLVRIGTAVFGRRLRT